MNHSFSFSLVIPGRTCALSDTSLQLAPAPITDLAVVGVSTGDTPLRVVMNCPRDGIEVDLTLHDALDASNGGSALTPDGSQSSEGIAVQLMRDGHPVRFGAAWRHAAPHVGDQYIELVARYLRTADSFAPGTVQGRAILTANYQ